MPMLMGKESRKAWLTCLDPNSSSRMPADNRKRC
jgi:hypothetical protein